MLDFLEENNLLDIWKIMNEDKRQFTWWRLNPVRKQARLDFFLISDNISHFVTDTQIIPGFCTDHSGTCILLKLILREGVRGPGYWKFNNTLLKDKDYVTIVKQTTNEVKRTYVINENDLEIADNNETIQFYISDQLFLETLLMIIRGNTINYSSEKKKISKIEENILEKEINMLEQEINDNLINISQEKLQLLEQKKINVVNIRRQKIEGVMLRSKCRYQDLGEKPTEYFLNLESRNYTSKTINKLIDEDDKEYRESNDILNLQKEFYKKLYSKNEEINEGDIETLIGEKSEKWSDAEAEDLEGEIKYTEILQALINMDSLQNSLSFFWTWYGTFILRSLNYAFRNWSLSVTQKHGIITCLPKNWGIKSLRNLDVSKLWLRLDSRIFQNIMC